MHSGRCWSQPSPMAFTVPLPKFGDQKVCPSAAITDFGSVARRDRLWISVLSPQGGYAIIIATKGLKTLRTAVGGLPNGGILFAEDADLVQIDNQTGFDIVAWVEQVQTAYEVERSG